MLARWSNILHTPYEALKIYLEFEHYQKYINIGLQNVAGEFDYQPQQSLPCTLSTQLFDQWGDHLERRAELHIRRNCFNVTCTEFGVSYSYDE